MATLLALREQVADCVRDPNNRIRSTSVVDRAINKAYLLVQQDLEGFIDDTVTSTTISVIANTQEYALPANFLTLQTAQLANVTLYQTTKQQLINANLFGNTGTPQSYYIRWANIGLYPSPIASGTLTINYVATLPTITTSIDSENPTMLDDAIVYRATAILYRQVQKFQEANLWEVEAIKEIDKARYSLRKDDNLQFGNGWELPMFYSPKSYWYER